MGRHIWKRFGLASALLALTAVICALPSSEAGGAPSGEIERGGYHPSAVKGQTIELEVVAPPNATKMSFKMQQKEQMIDTEPPFRFSITTDDLRPAHYGWHSSATGTGCCDGQSTGGSIQIYPLPRLRAPKISALVLAGTAKVVGLVVSRVAPGKIVRAWSFPRTSSTGLIALPLQLRQKHSAKRVYRFGSGVSVNAGRRTEIAVEVAPTKPTVRHGVELRGRLARVWLTRNHHTGVTRAHRSRTVACTTEKVRKESFPGSLSCAIAPPEPTVAIVCIKSLPCSPGTAVQARAQD